MTENSNETVQTAPQTNGSTLIEFPGAHRNRPAWRKELSERFREIQQKRAREAALESDGVVRSESDAGLAEYADANAAASSKSSAETAKQLGLVPPPPPAEPVEMNPIVQAALRRIERARKPEMAPPHAGRGGSNRAPAAATAAARVFEEQPETAVETRPELVTPKRAEARHASPASAEVAEQTEKAEAGEAARASSLSVVTQKQASSKPAQAEASATATTAAATSETTPAAEAATTVISKSAPAAQAKTEAPAVKTLDNGEAALTADVSTAKPQPRRVAGVIDDHWLERHGVETLPKVETVELTYDDRAPRLKRFAAGLFDLLVVAFLSAPFAAVIELTIGNWGDPRVWGSMAGIVAVVMFLYLTCSLALASRTLGMKVFSMHAVDANTAHAPTNGQCARRALVYMLSLVTFGIGILYALFDAEGRTAHDILSRTVVVKQ